MNRKENERPIIHVTDLDHALIYGYPAREISIKYGDQYPYAKKIYGHFRSIERLWYIKKPFFRTRTYITIAKALIMAARIEAKNH